MFILLLMTYTTNDTVTDNTPMKDTISELKKDLMRELKKELKREIDTEPEELYFDGCAKGNPGKGGCGAYLSNKNIKVFEYLGITTNNVAEYRGMILGLKICIENKIKNIVVKGDSLLVIKQMKGEYKVKAPNLLPLYNEAKDLIKHLEVKFVHIPREYNTVADELANLSLKNHIQ